MALYYIKKKQNNPTNRESPRKGHTNLAKKLDRVFSLYIRLRDAMPNGYTRCISCGKIKPFEDMDCGHFHSRTHMATRFDEDNCHAECSYCNRFSADHLLGYQANLIRKIGMNRYEKLNVKAHSTCHWLESELEERIRYYSEQVKILSREKGIKVKS